LRVLSSFRDAERFALFTAAEKILNDLSAKNAKKRAKANKKRKEKWALAKEKHQELVVMHNDPASGYSFFTDNKYPSFIHITTPWAAHLISQTVGSSGNQGALLRMTQQHHWDIVNGVLTRGLPHPVSARYPMRLWVSSTRASAENHIIKRWGRHGEEFVMYEIHPTHPKYLHFESQAWCSPMYFTLDHDDVDTAGPHVTISMIVL
jgi:hypothetical protein